MTVSAEMDPRDISTDLGVNSSLVGEGTESSDWVVEWHVDLDGLCNHILDLLDLLQSVLGLDVVTIGHNHTGHQTTERSDTVALTNTNY